MKPSNYLRMSLCFAMLAFAVPAYGQDNTEGNGCGFCIRGRPKGKCCSFLIYESGLLSRISGSGQPSSLSKLLITTDLGLMFNRSNSSAIGASFHLAADHDYYRFGIGLRYRKWLTKKSALDLSPRLLIAGTNDRIRTFRFPGFAFSASYSIYELLSIDAYFDIIRYEKKIYSASIPYETTVNETQTGLYLGASGRSWAVLALPIVFIVAIVIYGGDLGIGP